MKSEKESESRSVMSDPMDYTVHGILQARILEWVAFPFSRGSSQPRSPSLQTDSLPFEPQGKPLKTVRVVDKKMLTDLEDSAMQDLFF